MSQLYFFPVFVQGLWQFCFEKPAWLAFLQREVSLINLFTLHETAVTTGGAVCPSAAYSWNKPKGRQPFQSLHGV